MAPEGGARSTRKERAASTWSVPVQHAASRHDRPTPVRRARATQEENAPMLPMNTTPLNERLIQVLIEEHQAEIRRCFAPRPEGGRARSLVRRLSLLMSRRRVALPSPCRNTAVRVQDDA
jgi:hypothetical protein